MKAEIKRDKVGNILETAYGIDLNTVEKILQNSFTPGQLSPWFLFSKTAVELSQLLYVSSQVLNADTEHLSVTSEDGKEITYFINIGRDAPGKLRRILDENSGIDLVSFDSVKVGSGRRIVTLEKRGRRPLSVEGPNFKAMEMLRRSVLETAEKKGYRFAETFLAGLPPNYLLEEAKYDSRSARIMRHLDLFEEACRSGRVVLHSDAVHEGGIDPDEKRITIATPSVFADFPRLILGLVRKHNLNLTRTFWDVFSNSSSDSSVGIISLYFTMNSTLEPLVADLGTEFGGKAETVENATDDDAEWESLIRNLSAPDSSTEEIEARLAQLRQMTAENTDSAIPGDRLAGNLLLNALCGFFDAADAVGLGKSNRILADLISFERFDEFWVNTVKSGVRYNAEGFRVKHSTARGPSKGGIRNAMIVDFAEVSGLSFLMTWKCARTGILFGGGKGGLKIDPSEYVADRIDLFDTLSSFGRALFHVTGPAEDVPAGDVGCGPVEIGQMFEGFKSALHDLALIAGGIKKSGAVSGHKVVSLGEARRMLQDNYDIDVHDTAVMSELTSSEKFLELVAAAHITGKPKMGIATRNGATGRGLCYSILATVANEYTSGRWNAGRDLTADEDKRVQALVSLEKGGISEKDWKTMTPIFTKLLDAKTVLVQGSGKVGSSLIAELQPYGVKFIGVADGGGAVFGKSLKPEVLLKAARDTGTVLACDAGIEETITGAREGSALLTRPCDLLVLAALENAVTIDNVSELKASLIACGSNGPITPKAEAVLQKEDVTVIYDFLANSGGVTASYFEWLRNLSDRFRYEAEVIRKEEYDPSVMEPYVMPEYAGRIAEILSRKESDDTTSAWNALIRDIMVIAVNADYRHSREWSTPMKTAGFADSLLKVLSARLMKAGKSERKDLWENIPGKTRKALVPYLNSPESRLFNEDAEAVAAGLAGR